MEDILAIAEKILRASADNHRRAAGKRCLDRRFGNSGDPARIEQMQPVGGRQASLKRSPKKVLENPVHGRIASPFSPLDCLWRTLGQSRDFLRQPLVPQIPSKTAGDQTGNFGCSAAELALNCYRASPLRLSSTHRDISARSWIILLQEERKNEHDGAERAQDPKDVHIGQCAALLMHQFVESRNRLVVGVRGPKPGVRDL